MAPPMRGHAPELRTRQAQWRRRTTLGVRGFSGEPTTNVDMATKTTRLLLKTLPEMFEAPSRKVERFKRTNSR